MNKKEYNELFDVEEIKHLITAEDLKNKTNRTLIYGYTCERETFHVYLKDNKIYTVIYFSGEVPKEIEVISNRDYKPNKRAYPERCDFEFCKLLAENGAFPTFTTWTENVPEKEYYGELLPE